MNNDKPKDNEIESKDKSYLKVSPTAYGVAFRRILAGIDCAQEIYDELERIKAAQTPEDVDMLEKMKAPELTPYFEARYKLINRLLKENKAEQVLEVAAGFSPRGISMAEGNPALKYVELDLEGIINEKEQINKALAEQGKIEERENHHLEKGDALDMQSLFLATRHFDKKPIAVVNEGLMRYLTFEQKAQYARNVATLLKEFGGVWITPDINLKGLMKAAQPRTEKFSRDLGIDINANLFENEAEARKFFEDLGFIIEIHPFREIENDLVSPEKLGTSADTLSDLIDEAFVYVMRLKE